MVDNLMISMNSYGIVAPVEAAISRFARKSRVTVQGALSLNDSAPVH